MVQAGRLLEAHESFRIELSDDFSRWTIGRKKLGAEKSLTKKYNKQVLMSTLKKKFCHSAARRGKIFQDATTRKLLIADENFSLKTAMKIRKLSGAVHAAGIFFNTPLRAYDEEEARRVMDVSFWAGIRLMQIVNKKKNSEEGCSSVLFSSVAATIGEKSNFAYSSAKIALQAAVRAVAKEIYSRKNRINTISPGWVHTEMTYHEEKNTQVSNKFYDWHLLGIGKPEDVSGMVLFLLSERARWITGTNVVVDGGYLLGGYN